MSSCISEVQQQMCKKTLWTVTDSLWDFSVIQVEGLQEILSTTLFSFLGS